jgi:hypothetical protein
MDLSQSNNSRFDSRHPLLYPLRNRRGHRGNHASSINVRRTIKFLLLAIIVIGACFCYVQSGHASADPFLDGKIKALNDRVASWERDGHIVGWLIFSAFFIGLVVTTLQAVPTWWMKILTAGLSLVGAAIIGYYHQFFPADDRTYDKAVREARGLLEDFSLQLDRYTTLDAATKNALENKFRQVIVAIGHIEDATIHSGSAHSGTEQTSSDAGVGLILLPSAQAQTKPGEARRPAWIDTLPNDEKNFYFLGIGTGTTFEEARQNALLDGRKAVTALFVQYAKESFSLARNARFADRLTTALAKGAEIADTFVVPEKAAAGYRGFALLRLSKSAARFSAESIFVETSVPYDNSFLNKLQKDSQY